MRFSANAAFLSDVRKGPAALDSIVFCTPMGAFVGDGKYQGDGCSALQTLWSISQWKEIRGCPGRYVCRDHALARKSPADVLALAAPPLAVCGSQHSANGKDPIEVRYLVDGGGGLLSYLKSDGARVHTFNTRSGMCRKLEALGICPAAVVGPTAPPGPRHELGICIAILAFTDADQKNVVAVFLCTWVHCRFFGPRGGRLGFRPQPLPGPRPQPDPLPGPRPP